MTKCKVTKYKLKKNKNSATFCTFLGPLVGLFLESGSGSKTLLELTYAVNQLWFWKYSPIFLLLHRPNLGPFIALFGPLGVIFGVGVRFKNIFGTYLHSLTTFILKVQLYLALLKLSQGWGGGGGWLDIAISMKAKLSAYDFDFD